MNNNIILGIDIGGSGVKGSLVDLDKGKLLGERYRIPTPSPSTPKALADTCAEIVSYFNYQGVVGIGFPAIVKAGVSLSASNIDKGWIGTNIETAVEAATKDCFVYATNDADAAGIAEMRFGLGKDQNGLVILITIGTGLGSAVFYRGMMLPNTELGHLIFPNKTIAEAYCSSGSRERLKMSRSGWAERFNEYLLHLDRLFSPDMFILGGGESKLFDSYKEQLTCKAIVAPATLKNNAGIIGAAMFAAEESKLRIKLR